MSPAEETVHVFCHPAQDVTAQTVEHARQAAFVAAGSTDHFVVAYQRELGSGGAALARVVLASCEADYSRLQAWFAGLVPSGLPFTCRIVPGSFGAGLAGRSRPTARRRRPS